MKLRDIIILSAAVLLSVFLIGCAAGPKPPVKPPAPVTRADPAAGRKAFREAMVLARDGRMAAAAPYYVTAAENDHAEAQYILATMYKTGRGMPRDMKKAVHWYNRSAQSGYALAQFTLGNIFMSGDGVPKNVPMAVKLFRQAAEQGHAQAQYNMGVYNYSVVQDYPVAEQWFMRGAKQGEPSSQYALGRIYAAPHNGVRLDPVRAFAWLEIAASKGHAKAGRELRALESRLSLAERAAGRSLARRLEVESTQ